MWKIKAEKWALLGVGVFVVVMICAGIVGYNEQKEVQEQVNVVEDDIVVIGTYTIGGLRQGLKIHDNKDNVTCWVYRGGHGGGISCIPDHLLSP
jgi:hypothetical protein